MKSKVLAKAYSNNHIASAVIGQMTARKWCTLKIHDFMYSTTMQKQNKYKHKHEVAQLRIITLSTN